jgi:hypothetical protein
VGVTDNSNQRLRCERFERKPKEVIRGAMYTDHTKRVASDEHLLNDLEEIADCLEAGRALKRRFYRTGLDLDDDDELLRADGIKHLHLGDSRSDVLLFAVEYEDRVVFLEVNTHKHFRTEPKGSVLLSLHQRLLAKEDEAAAHRASQRED